MHKKIPIKKPSESSDDKFRAILSVANELSRVASVNDLCRRVVELGRERLGFWRLSVWFVDQDKRYIDGSFGVDETGQLRYEGGEQVLLADDLVVSKMNQKGWRSIFEDGVMIYDNRHGVVGKGIRVISTVLSGDSVIGYLFSDSLLSPSALTAADRERVEIYASIFGHLYSLKKAEESLSVASTKLEEIQSQLAEATKMKLGGELASGVVHEVKNPLGVIIKGIEYLSEKIDKNDTDAVNILSTMDGAVRRANNILMGLLDASRLSRLNLDTQSIEVVVESSLSLVKHQLEKYNIKVVKNYDRNVPNVIIDRNKIEQVMLNVLLNSVYSMDGGGELTINIYSTKPGQGPSAVFVEVIDTGHGIPNEIIDKIFDPFFTTREKKGGTGMGLSIVKSIMDLHRGSVKVSNREGTKGAKVTLVFKL